MTMKESDVRLSIFWQPWQRLILSFKLRLNTEARGQDRPTDLLTMSSAEPVKPSMMSGRMSEFWLPHSLGT